MNALCNPLLCILLAVAGAPASSQREPVPPTKPAVRDQLVVLYEVRDLLPTFGRQFAAPRLGEIVPYRKPEPAAPMKPVPAPEAARPEGAERNERAAQDLVALLKRHVQPAFVEAEEELQCEPTGTLIAHLNSDQHTWVAGFLDRLRTFQGQVEVRTCLIEGPAAVLTSLGLEDTSVLAGHDALELLQERVRATSGCNLLSAPRLVTRPAQHASLSSLDEFKFVSDWSLERVEPGPREIAVPDLSVIHEGVALDVCALPMESGAFRVELGVQHAQVRRPVRTATVSVGKAGEQHEIALPESDVVRFEPTLLVADGSTIVVRSPFPDAEKALALVVCVRRVVPETR